MSKNHVLVDVLENEQAFNQSFDMTSGEFSIEDALDTL